MMIHGLVFDTDAPFRTVAAPPASLPPAQRLAGLTLLRRAILAAWKAGAEQVIVVARDAAAAEQWARTEQGLPVPVRVVTDDAPLDVDDADLLLALPAQVLSDGALLERLVEMGRRSGATLVAVADPTPCSGPALITAEAWRRSAAAGEGAAASLRRVLSAAERFPANPESYRHLADARALAQADHHLYHNLSSIADGYVDRVFNRRISRWFTRRIIDLPITPNQVTGFHFALGLLAAGCFWQSEYPMHVLGAVLFQLSAALDCSDGEVARLKYQFSKLGSWLDVAADNVVNVALFAAIARSAAVGSGTRLALTLGVLAVLGVLMCIGVVYGMSRLQERLRPGRASSLAATNRLSSHAQAASDRQITLVDRIINEATSRDFSVLVVLFTLSGRLDWFLWLAAVGSHIFWIVFAGIQLSLLRVADAQSR